jgi:hypothetical protein
MSNPSMQCSVCGRWMRLTDIETNMQRFYPCCGDNGEYLHEKNVCVDCCESNCPYKPMTERFYKTNNTLYFKDLQAVTMRDLKNNGGYTIKKGTVVSLNKRHRGFEINAGDKRKDGTIQIITRVSYKDIRLIENHA